MTERRLRRLRSPEGRRSPTLKYYGQGAPLGSDPIPHFKGTRGRWFAGREEDTCPCPSQEDSRRESSRRGSGRWALASDGGLLPKRLGTRASEQTRS
jgi:hypothetical protein